MFYGRRYPNIPICRYAERDASVIFEGAPSKVQSQYPATGNLISKIMYLSELNTFFC